MTTKWICECGYRNDDELNFKCKKCKKSVIQGKLKSAWKYGGLAVCFPLTGIFVSSLLQNPIGMIITIGGLPFLLKCTKLNLEWKEEKALD